MGRGPDDIKIIKWCEVMQTEVHEGPYPATSQCDDLLIRLRVTVQSAAFQIQTDPPHSFLHNFVLEQSILGDESKVWVNLSAPDNRRRSLRDVMCALALMGVEEIYWKDIALEMLRKVEAAIPLPQLAIDVTVRFVCAELFGPFDGYDDMLLNHYVKKSWEDFRATTTSCPSSHMPSSSCAVCLEDFGGGVDDEMIARLPCLHYFHAACSSQWVRVHHTCPMCRGRMIARLCDENESFILNPSRCS